MELSLSLMMYSLFFSPCIFLSPPPPPPPQNQKHTPSLLPVAMAGNIIPAIATTNAVIAGLIVMEALKVLTGELDKCKTVSLIKINDPINFLKTTMMEQPFNYDHSSMDTSVVMPRVQSFLLEFEGGHILCLLTYKA